MNGITFRSQLMQQFIATTRTQSRPPIALFSSLGYISNLKIKGSIGHQGDSGSAKTPPTPLASVGLQAPPVPLSSTHSRPPSNHQRCYVSSSDIVHPSEEEFVLEKKQTSPVNSGDGSNEKANRLSPKSQSFQHLLASRRTVSNFLKSPPINRPPITESPQPNSPPGERSAVISSEPNTKRNHIQFLRDAIQRGVECASTAPNHRITEPTTYYRIFSPSLVSEKLLDVAYDVTLLRLQKLKLSGDEACISEARRKREKWEQIPAFIVVTVGGMEDQCGASPDRNEDSNNALNGELPFVAPTSIRQLEDYASACASIQNLLLSLHSEGLGSKWATGPIIRTRAFRRLVGCQNDEMVAGLIMVGWPKRFPRTPRRKRNLVGDILRDVEL